jgi:predicted NBD/HSP70 family sugar kinase
VFRHVEVTNDAEGGIMAASLEAARRFPDVRDVIYVINGSGLGGAVLTGNVIYATEPGHIQISEELNTHGQRRSCGLDGAVHVCIEAVAASKAGIEDIWFQRTDERMTGQEISGRYLAGDQNALDMYNNSAWVTAHAVKGIAAAFDLPAARVRLVIVGHGGIFQVPGYSERLSAILEREFIDTTRIIFTKDFSTNTCLEGAAIAAASQTC